MKDSVIRCFHNFVYIGRNWSSFILLFEHHVFTKGDIIRPVGTSYQVKIHQSRKYAYLCNLLSDDYNSYLPREYTVPGTCWEKVV